MRVRYNKRIGVLFLILGLFLGVLAALPGNLSFMGVVTPAALLGFGVLLLNRTYFRVDDHALVVEALLGSATKTYRFYTSDKFQFDGRRLFLVQEARRDMVRVSAWLTNQQDWIAFRRWVDARTTPGRSL